MRWTTTATARSTRTSPRPSTLTRTPTASATRAPRSRDCDPGEGYVADATDCDDTDPTSFPGGEEICDEADNDCDGTVDEDVTTTYYVDVDGDTYGLADATTEACALPEGYAEVSGDCDDTLAAVNPDALEVCNTIDDDCDGTIDEDDAADALTWHADADGDGYGDASSTTAACAQPSGYVSDDTDCDDGEVLSNPGETEVCDELDNDCDGTVDEDDASDAETWYADDDGDGYGDVSDVTVACDQPSGTVANDDDCDDGEALSNPGETEVCDELDNDCDGTVDEDDATDASTWYADDDSDGYGDASDSTDACEAPSGYVEDDTDCDDTEADINPGAAEVCDEDDNDCDGDTDEDVTTTYYADSDGDGYGDAASTTEDCSVPSGYAADDTDCDDTDGDVNPGAAEVCNEEDDDCDGSIDEDAASPETFYADDDGDGYGDAADSEEGCEAPSGYVEDDTDCDDTEADINPAAAEVCNGEDDDCDGDADDGVLGDGEDCPADDCLSILTEDSTAADGDYWIDFDGTATETACDMTTDGGGWTLIFEDDFESTPDSGWSLSSRYSCGSWSYLLGGYGIISGGEIDITVDAYSISHTEAWVELEYAKLDSWDGEEAYVEVDGSSVWSDNLYYYEGSEVCGWNRGWSGSYDDLHTISEFVSHSSDSLELIAGSTLNQSSTDESFGIDDVVIWIR